MLFILLHKPTAALDSVAENSATGFLVVRQDAEHEHAGAVLLPELPPHHRRGHESGIKEGGVLCADWLFLFSKAEDIPRTPVLFLRNRRKGVAEVLVLKLKGHNLCQKVGV